VAGILILYEPLPEELRSVIDAEAYAKDWSPYDVVRKVLSDRYGLAYENLSHYRPAGERFKLRVSKELRKKINLEAARNGGTIRGVVLSVLASHYGLDPISTGRRPRSTA
jgi:hypothetical protein